MGTLKKQTWKTPSVNAEDIQEEKNINTRVLK